MFASRVVSEARRAYVWHDLTNPAYNGFFHSVWPKVTAGVSTVGSAFCAYTLLFATSER